MNETAPLAASAGLALLAAKMAATAIFVVAVALISERAGPFLAAMTASLPIYTGPVYLFLALDHGPEYLAQALVGSTAIAAAVPVFALAYCVLAQRFGSVVSLSGALLAWAMFAALVRSRPWTEVEAAILCAGVFAVSLPLAGYFKHAAIAGPVKRAWIDLPLRAVLVAATVALVSTVSAHTPPTVTGILTVLPIIFSSLVLVLHPRMGGPATAVLMAHSLTGVVGMVIAFVVAHFAILRIGTAAALGIGLLICVSWNLMLVLARHRPAWRRR